ncbi:hypothetical protein Nepgr_030230 [Nepenthes gracilis]|uniref:GATA-type domain-containing protein n=1 Tax=Nepenthes gracilis TaxID=150966 RepID=A0AAD3TFD8_NEPGR|nr:hypothetical protein Nepgr_030230 [Nepenthes gracilis]
MDFHRSPSVSGAPTLESSPEDVLAPACSHLGSVSELFPHHDTEVDVSLEWLSTYVEECLTSSGNCLLSTPQYQNLTTHPNPFKSNHKPRQIYPFSLTKFAVPGKPRSKRRRPTAPKTQKTSLITRSTSSHLKLEKSQTLQLTCSDPLLLQQSHWLADSELITLPRNEGSSFNGKGEASNEEEEEKKMMVGKENSEGQGQGRRCSHCQAQRTPQWREGPLGPKTLCNACGVRFKSGRLFPEYRPAKSPTFVSCMHSNSHKKVLQIRMALPSSPDQH